MEQLVMFFREINKSDLPYVGGKGANLGDITQAGFPVPPGFCVTTLAYRSFIQNSQKITGLLNLLDQLHPDHLDEISKLGKQIRDHLESTPIPEPIKAAIIKAWQKSGTEQEYAVRSSATAEDLPSASFAGQQETYLNIKGSEQLLQAVRKCWASLFTDRSIVYRLQNGFCHRSVFLAVVVQRMIFPEVSGIMFTADPVTGNRKIISIDASFGLGEALVSGIVSADLYQIKLDKLIKKRIARKESAIYAKFEGGTQQVNIPAEKQSIPALTEAQAVELARIAQKIQDHFDSPQDIEWGLAGNEIFILQSRPITTLYPVPQVNDDILHLFLSLGHQQMMTEAIKPLGISVLRTIFPFGKNSPREESQFLQEAGNRLYADMTSLLEYPQARKRLPDMLLNIDELFSKALLEFIKREDYLASGPPHKKIRFSLVRNIYPTVIAVAKNILYRKNNQVIEKTNQFISEQIHITNNKLREVSGSARIVLIQDILNSTMPTVVTNVVQYLASALITYGLIKNKCLKWLGDTAEFVSISKSPPGNVTTEMGLALGDLSDSIRDHPAIITYLEHAVNSTFWDDLKSVPGGEEVLPIFQRFMKRYGMRGTGEIDITRPRWRESPTQLVPAILSHIKSAQPGQHRLDFLTGQENAELAVHQLLERLSSKPRGFIKVKIMRRLIKVHRSLIGLRESPKYYIVQQLDLIKQAILQEAAALVTNGILDHPEDVFWLSLQEIIEVIETQYLDRNIITMRQEKFRLYEKITPPRAITSEGEVITAKLGVILPSGALAGSPVSAGIVEGRARIILKLEEAKINKGEILVTRFTDPAWTPLFPLAAGLVTEVGGLMTHGAVVAREYGIPAVVGVDDATRKIKDGQIIRIDGTKGIITFLETEEER